ncbi:MAG: hypothetical protein ACYC35_21105 [Pirellulales bacterium]
MMAQQVGFSEEARFVYQAVQETRRRLRDSNALGLGGSMRDEFAAVWEECREADWDAFQAAPVSQATLRCAYLLLESLPLGCPGPSIGAEPDGDLTLEWYVGPRRTLSVSVNAEGDLHYAAIFGPSRAYGTEAFWGEIPNGILGLIRRVFSA